MSVAGYSPPFHHQQTARQTRRPFRTDLAGCLHARRRSDGKARDRMIPPGNPYSAASDNAKARLKAPAVRCVSSLLHRVAAVVRGVERSSPDRRAAMVVFAAVAQPKSASGSPEPAKRSGRTSTGT